MSRCYKYAIAQFASESTRNERLNIALVILKEEDLDVVFPKSLDKLKAITAALDTEVVRATLNGLADLDALVGKDLSALERINSLAALGPIQFSPLGEFYAESAASYTQITSRLMAQLVEPEPSRAAPPIRRGTRLFADVKAAFKSEKVLARKGEDLNKHRIVTNHKVAEGLAADLLLKNGAFHVVQTVDASSDGTSLRRMIADVAISALVFEQARMSFGENNTKSRLVYRATSSLERVLSPSLEAAEHQGASLVNWESRDDRTRFVVELSSLADPLDGSSRFLDNFHASSLAKRQLN